MTLTAEQIQVMSHALGLPSQDEATRAKHRSTDDCYRNYFLTGSDGDDYRTLMQLKERGFVTHRHLKAGFAATEMFHVTEDGFEVLLREGHVSKQQELPL